MSNLDKKTAIFLKYLIRANEIARIFNNAVLNITPKWFTFLGWLSLLIALTYFYEETRSTLIFILIAISYILLYGFFSQYISIIKKTVRVPFLSIILTILVYLFIVHFINLLPRLKS